MTSVRKQACRWCERAGGRLLTPGPSLPLFGALCSQVRLDPLTLPSVWLPLRPLPLGGMTEAMIHIRFPFSRLPSETLDPNCYLTCISPPLVLLLQNAQQPSH